MARPYEEQYGPGTVSGSGSGSGQSGTGKKPPKKPIKPKLMTNAARPAHAQSQSGQAPRPDFRRPLPTSTPQATHSPGQAPHESGLRRQPPAPTPYSRPVDATNNPRGSVRIDPTELTGGLIPEPHAGWGSDGKGILLHGPRAPERDEDGLTPGERRTLEIKRKLHASNPDVYEDPDARPRSSQQQAAQPGGEQEEQEEAPPEPSQQQQQVDDARAQYAAAMQAMNEAAANYGQAGARETTVDWSTGVPRVMTRDPGGQWVPDQSQNWDQTWGDLQRARGVLSGGPVQTQDFSKTHGIVDSVMGTAGQVMQTADEVKGTAGEVKGTANEVKGTAGRLASLGMVQPHRLMQTGGYQSGAMSMPQILNYQQDMLKGQPTTGETADEAEAYAARTMGFDSPEAMREWYANARGSSVNDMQGLTQDERATFDQQLHTQTQLMQDQMARAIDNIAGETGSTQRAFQAADSARRQIQDHRIQHQLGVFEADLMRKQTDFQAQQDQFKMMVAQGAMSQQQYVGWVHTDRAMTMQGWAQQMQQTLATFEADVGASGQHFDQRSRSVSDYADRQMGAGQLQIGAGNLQGKAGDLQIGAGNLQIGAGQLQLGAGRLDLDTRKEAFSQDRTAVNDYISNMKTTMDMDLGLRTAVEAGMDRSYERNVRPHVAQLEAASMQLATNTAWYEAMFGEKAHEDATDLAQQGIEVQREAIAAQRAAQSANTAMGIFGMLFKGILGAATGGLLG